MASAFGKRLTLVVAPAGSGKTTLLARFATRCGAPVAWYRAESWDADEPSFVRHLEASLARRRPRARGATGRPSRTRPATSRPRRARARGPCCS